MPRQARLDAFRSSSGIFDRHLAARDGAGARAARHLPGRHRLELGRSLHLNPLRAQVVPDLRTLAHFPWTGPSALLGTVPRP